MSHVYYEDGNAERHVHSVPLTNDIGANMKTRIEFEYIVEALPAWDRRDPNPSENYGIHGVTLKFVLKGPHGAIEFVVFTNWQLPKVQEDINKKASPDTAFMLNPMPADLGYHSPVPQYDGQGAMDDKCEYTGGRCYYDGSGLQAEDVFKKVFLTGGTKALWKHMEERYRKQFVENDYRGYLIEQERLP